jgi:hypothetical protein
MCWTITTLAAGHRRVLDIRTRVTAPPDGPRCRAIRNRAVVDAQLTITPSNGAGAWCPRLACWTTMHRALPFPPTTGGYDQVPRYWRIVGACGK